MYSYSSFKTCICPVQGYYNEGYFQDPSLPSTDESEDPGPSAMFDEEGVRNTFGFFSSFMYFSCLTNLHFPFVCVKFQSVQFEPNMIGYKSIFSSCGCKGKETEAKKK